jgi:hypothetical protein
MVTGALGEYRLEAELPIVVAFISRIVCRVRQQGGEGRRAALAILRLRGGRSSSRASGDLGEVQVGVPGELGVLLLSLRDDLDGRVWEEERACEGPSMERMRDDSE